MISQHNYKFEDEHKKNFEKKLITQNFYSKFFITNSHFDNNTTLIKRFVNNNLNSFSLSNTKLKINKNLKKKIKKNTSKSKKIKINKLNYIHLNLKRGFSLSLNTFTYRRNIFLEPFFFNSLASNNFKINSNYNIDLFLKTINCFKTSKKKALVILKPLKSGYLSYSLGVKGFLPRTHASYINTILRKKRFLKSKFLAKIEKNVKLYINKKKKNFKSFAYRFKKEFVSKKTIKKLKEKKFIFKTFKKSLIKKIFQQNKIAYFCKTSAKNLLKIIIDKKLKNTQNVDLWNYSLNKKFKLIGILLRIKPYFRKNNFSKGFNRKKTIINNKIYTIFLTRKIKHFFIKVDYYEPSKFKLDIIKNYWNKRLKKL
jgi:hypothetical protein